MSRDLEFVVNAKSESPAKTTIRTRNFSLVVDEPQNLGGTDQAPNPVEYLLASYAGCLNVVAHLTAAELNLKIGRISFSISGVLNPDRLLKGVQRERPGFRAIEVKLFTELPLTVEEHEKWISEIENRCPVGDNLVNPTPVTIDVFSSTHVN